MGYFRFRKKFFTPEQFYQEDVDYVAALLGIRNIPDISKYRTSTYAGHRVKILDLLGYLSFSENIAILEKEAKALVRTSLRPKDIFHSLLDFLDERKIERPKYYVFAQAIRNALNSFETELVRQLDGILTTQQKEMLDGLIDLPSDPDVLSSRKPYLTTKLKRPNQQTTLKKIRESLNGFYIIKDLHCISNSYICR